MCLFCIRIRGVRVCGRQMYRTPQGVCLGYKGPTVSLESVLSELSLPLAQSVADNVAAIDRKLLIGEIKDSSGMAYILPETFASNIPSLSANDADGPWYADENPALVQAAADVGLSVLPPDVACREDELLNDSVNYNEPDNTPF